jgi:PhzF family phenazine biosynthesis protein
MRVRMFQVDAFANRVFGGNPAAVLPLENFPDDATMLAIAAENNLSETAFLVRDGAEYRLRWFTPRVEVPLCGHGTLATAAVVMERLEPGRRRVEFSTLSGPLTVERAKTGYVMSLPVRLSDRATGPVEMAAALGVQPKEVWENKFNYMAVLRDEDEVRRLAPDLAVIARMDRPGVIVTGRGAGEFDFVSRYFAPAKGIPEDPVTGAAHCMLAPYWAKQRGKTTLRAYQASARGGEVRCNLVGDRVELEGNCAFYLEGEVEI